MKPSPSFTARRSAFGWWPPNQSGGGGRLPRGPARPRAPRGAPGPRGCGAGRTRPARSSGGSRRRARPDASRRESYHTGRGGIVWGAVGTADPNRHDQETAMNPLKELIAKAVDRLGDDLERLSHRIHDNPELGYAEVKAAAWLTEFLDAQGFKS